MSGVAICRYLLANNATLTTSVPAVRIMAGVLPLNTILPAIGVTEVSGVPRNTVAMTPGVLVTERVQITVMAKTYPTQKNILALVRTALPVSRGIVNGMDCDSIIPDSEGPDFNDVEATVFMQTHDFFVRYRRI